jgi:hypothetical protein
MLRSLILLMHDKADTHNSDFFFLLYDTARISAILSLMGIAVHQSLTELTSNSSKWQSCGELCQLFYCLMCKHLLTLKLLKASEFKSHNMFRPIWPSSGVKIYLMRKPLLFVVAVIACVGPSDARARVL